MRIFVSKPRDGLYPPNRGMDRIANNKIDELVNRAALRSQRAVLTDGHAARIWIRQPRAAQMCPCSGGGLSARPSDAAGLSTKISIEFDRLEGDDLGLVDRGWPLQPQPVKPGPITLHDGYTDTTIKGQAQPTLAPSVDIPAHSTLDGIYDVDGAELPDGTVQHRNDGTPFDDPVDGGYTDELVQELLGEGRRCALCWGTGWLDGYRLLGGERIVCTEVPTLSASVEQSTLQLEGSGGGTPAAAGPGYMVWKISTSSLLNKLDSIRVYSGENVLRDHQILARATPPLTNSSKELGWRPIQDVLGLDYGFSAGNRLQDWTGEIWLRVDIDDSQTFSMLELVLRSEDLTKIQLPQRAQTEAWDRIAPFLDQEFETDPIVGHLERGSLLEVLPINGRYGSLWLVNTVTVKQTAAGAIFGVTGQCTNVQPTSILNCATLQGINVGLLDPGQPVRNIEVVNSFDAPPFYNFDVEFVDAAPESYPTGSAHVQVIRFKGGAKFSQAGKVSLPRNIDWQGRGSVVDESGSHVDDLVVTFRQNHDEQWVLIERDAANTALWPAPLSPSVNVTLYFSYELYDPNGSIVLPSKTVKMIMEYR